MSKLRSSAIDAEPDVLVLCRDLARRMRLTSARRPAHSVPVQPLPGRSPQSGHPAARGRREQPSRDFRPRVGPPRPSRWVVEPLARSSPPRSFGCSPCSGSCPAVRGNGRGSLRRLRVEFGADRSTICRPPARAGRAAIAAAGAVRSRDDLAPVAAGASDRADPRLDADVIHSGRPSGHRRDARRWPGRNAPGGVAWRWRAAIVKSSATIPR